MTTQVVFNIDQGVKERAMRRARVEGIPFSSVLKLATKSYAEGDFSVGIVKEQFNQKSRREIKKILEEVDAGKGLSPALSNAKSAIKYLRSL